MRLGVQRALALASVTMLAACVDTVQVEGTGDASTAPATTTTTVTEADGAVMTVTVPVTTSGGSGDDSDAGLDEGDAGALFSTVHTGEVTFYAQTITNGNCSFGAISTNDFAALSQSTDYAGSNACGECIEITGKKGKVTVLAVDSCPGCAEGHLDLSNHAFDQLDDESVGVSPVTWQVVPCAVTGPIAYAFPSGVSIYYFSVNIQNTRVPVAKVELMVNGSYVEAPRTTYNDFVLDSESALPWQIRVTSQTGETLEDTFQATNAGTTVQGHAQF